MHAFLIVGLDQKGIDNEINKLSEAKKARILEFPFGKIEDSRNLSSSLKFSYESPVLIVLRSVDIATEESLNAFLKILEEPQANIYFALTASNARKVLSTVVSRCSLIKIIEESKLRDVENVKRFFLAGVGEKFSILESFRKRNAAVEFLDSLIIFLHNEMLKKDTNLSSISQTIHAVQATKQNIEGNGNVTLQLTNMVVNMSKG